MPGNGKLSSQWTAEAAEAVAQERLAILAVREWKISAVEV